MSSVNLKNVVGKKSELNSDILLLAKELNIEICVEDPAGKLLLGNPLTGDVSAFPIKLNDELLGWVKGGEKAAIIARLLSHLAAKEAEKKNLGNEVLNTYQELNVIFNFSEKLTETIDPEAIARITLEQAMHSISSHGGIIVL